MPLCFCRWFFGSLGIFNPLSMRILIVAFIVCLLFGCEEKKPTVIIVKQDTTLKPLPAANNNEFRRCSGGADCEACWNCNGCKNCNERGGTCSVCKPGMYSKK